MMTPHSLRACLYGCAAASLSLPALAADGGAFELGVVEVIGPRATPPASKQTVISQSLLRQFNRDTLGEAVGLTPGLSVSRNSRNEDTVYLRGFDIRQVPLFIDGIPAYVPYDGYVDFSRFTTADLAEVRIDKGAASLLYGPNALGGAINLVTRKPTEKLEGDIRAGLAAGNRQQYALNLGSRQDSWYVQLGASYSDSHSFPLSGSYDVRALPTSASNPSRTVLEDGGNRNNAYQTDSRISLKLGFTPNASDEYALGYVRQDGRKGNPPYAGEAPGQYLSIGGGANSRFWQWPYWDLESAYFISNTALGDAHQLKTRVYHDSYRNKILAYSTGSYSTQLSNTSNFPSWYNDSTSGFSVELTSFAINQHVLSLAYHHKIDKHADNGLTLTKRYEDLTRSLALEDRWQLAPAWQLRLGASHDSRSAKEVYYWPTGSTSANNWLAELSHSLHGGAVAYASAARKTRFPTIKDRYSASLGSGLPNAGLTPETALNLELGIKGSPTTELYFENCRVPGDRIIGDPGTGFKTALATLDHTRPTIGAQAVGIAQGALDAAIEYTKDRKQFGQSVSNFQAVQFMIADMAMKVEAARLLVYTAAARAERGEGNLGFMREHFKNAPLLASNASMLFWTLTLLEVLAGLFCALGILTFSFVYGGFFARWGLRFATLSLLSLLFGQRLAQDYAGAATVAPYFSIAMLGLLVFAIH